MRRRSAVVAGSLFMAAAAGVVGAEKEVFCEMLESKVGRLECAGSADRPPEYVGSGELQLTSEIGMMITHLTTELTMERTVTEAAVTYDADHVSAIAIDPMTVGYRPDEHGNLLVTMRSNGTDVGIQPSSLRFRLLYPEYDIADGERDGRCKTPPQSVDFTGCVYGNPMDQGLVDFPVVGADNHNQISARGAAIRDIKSRDAFCLMTYAVPEAMNTALAEHGRSLPAGPEAASVAAHLLVVGTVKLQISEAMGIEPENVLVAIDPASPYHPGPTYSQELARKADTGRLGDLTDADRSDDWCLGDVILPNGLREIVGAALSKPDNYSLYAGGVYE